MSIHQVVLYRRKREGRTNYKKRLVYLKSDKPRLVVRKTNQHVILQLIRYEPDGDKIIVGVTSGSLKKLGWLFSCKNVPACYLAGYLLGKKAKEAKTHEAILDFGLHTHVLGSKIYAAVKGAVDAGLKIPISDEAVPAKERLDGAHIASHFKSSADKFTKYNADKADPAKMAEAMAAVKKKIG